VSTQRSAQFAARWNQPASTCEKTFEPRRQADSAIKPVVSAVVNTDSVTAFGLFVATLFIGQLGTKGALTIVGLTGAYGLLHIMRLPEILRPRAFILAIPLVVIFSTFWSETPSETLKYSIEFAITVGAALMLSASHRPMAVLFGLFAAFAVYIAVSLAFGQTVQLGITGATAFSGLNRGKNLLADIASTGLLVSAAMFLAAAAERRLFLIAGAALVSLLQLHVLIEARSAGAMLGFGLAASVFMFLLALRSVGLAIRAAVTSFLVLCLLSASLSYRFLSSALIDTGARFFDKDPTLTGRTYLWQRAFDLINETPWLGRGFGSFWQQGNPDAEGLWQFAGIGSRSGFNFHNTAVEILVHLGWFGLIICTVVMIIAVGFLVARFLARPNLFHCFWLSVLTYEMVRTPIESIGLNEFYFSTLLLFMALGSAFALPVRRPVAVRSRHHSRAVARGPAVA
jgi:exopolysaccharide production protein ExoQ